MELIIFLILIVLGYVSGKMIESRHYKSIQAREQEFLKLPVVTLKKLDDGMVATNPKLVAGSVVISVDYFKRFLAGLRNLFGGRVTSYESLIDRARREAILRMKEEAKGADIILNMRIETSSIAKGRKGKVSSVEALAYGTAVKYKPGNAEEARPLQKTASQPAPEESITEPAISVETRYKVVFSGEVEAAHDVETVKTNIAALYKVPVERCESMFSGRPVTIKDNLDAQAAQKYKRAFERTGAICRIESM